MLLRFAVFLGIVNAAWAQTVPPDMSKLLDRLDKLERQNEAMTAEIRQLREELGTARAAERLEVQEARTEELAQAKVESSQKMPVSLTGMLLFNAFSNGRYGGTFQDPILAVSNPVQRPGGASFRQTVLGLKFHGPDLPGGGKVSGSFYM